MKKILNRFIKIQEELSKRVITEGKLERVETILGVDVSYKGGFQYTVVVRYSFKEKRLMDYVVEKEKVTFPYIPTYLSFREGPAAVLTIKRHFNLKNIDVIFVDGQGIAHPRRLGLATYIGVLLNKPTVGVAKSHLFGKFLKPGEKKGDFSYLFDGNKRIGVVLRSRDNTRPLFVSPGNMIGIDEAKELTLSLCIKYRIPEPIRISNKISKKVKEETWERDLV